MASTRRYSGVMSSVMNVHQVLFGHIILASRIGIVGVPINDLTFTSVAQRKLIAYNSEILSSATWCSSEDTCGQNRFGLQFCCLLLLHSKLVNNVCVCVNKKKKKNVFTFRTGEILDVH